MCTSYTFSFPLFLASFPQDHNLLKFFVTRLTKRIWASEGGHVPDAPAFPPATSTLDPRICLPILPWSHFWPLFWLLSLLFSQVSLCMNGKHQLTLLSGHCVAWTFPWLHVVHPWWQTDASDIFLISQRRGSVFFLGPAFGGRIDLFKGYYDMPGRIWSYKSENISAEVFRNYLNILISYESSIDKSHGMVELRDKS